MLKSTNSSLQAGMYMYKAKAKHMCAFHKGKGGCCKEIVIKCHVSLPPHQNNTNKTAARG